MVIGFFDDLERTYYYVVIGVVVTLTLVTCVLLVLMCGCAGGAVIYFLMRSKKSFDTVHSERDPLLSDLVGERTPGSGSERRMEPTSVHDVLEKGYKLEAAPGERREQHEQATFLNLQFYMRSHGSGLKLKGPLPGIGHRMDRCYFRVADERGRMEILTMTPPSQHCVLDLDADAAKATFLNLLLSARHPSILPTVGADYIADREMVLVRRPLSEHGSLRDLIYKARLSDAFAKKYNGQGQRIPVAQVAVWGRQILDGLDYLRRKGFVFGHLHAGNVIVDGPERVCRITDYENAFLNLEPFLQRFHTQLPDRDPDVIGFGNLLYEMACGSPLPRHDVLRIPAHCPKVIRDVLVAIFSDSEFDPLRTVAEVMEVPLFAKVSVAVPQKRVRIDTRGADLLRKVALASIVGRPDAKAEPRMVSLDAPHRRRKQKVRPTVPTASNAERAAQIDAAAQREAERKKRHPNDTSSSDWD